MFLYHDDMSTVVASLSARTLAGRAVLGFLSGAIGVAIGHQVMILILYLIGQVANPPYSFAPNPIGVPQILNNMFWGGLWGVLFAFVVPAFPRGWPTWMKGLVFGLGIHVILGNWLIIAMIRGQALFGGFVPFRMLLGALIGTSFGIGVAFAHAFLTRRFAR